MRVRGCGMAVLVGMMMTVAGADRAEAQPRPGAVTLALGSRGYDQGSTVMASLRTEVPVAPMLRVEFAGSVADRVLGPTVSATSLLELQIQVAAPLGAVLTPYAGAGAGIARTSEWLEGGSTRRAVVSAAVGVDAALSPELAVVGDARWRGVAGYPDSDHVDLSVGLRYQFR
jgi:opacity protein-like surface antigen